MIDEEKVLAVWLDKILRLHGSSRVLDYGCGRGRMSAVAARVGHRVVGVDVSAAMLAEARLAGLEALSTTEFAESNASYDVLILSHLIEHFAPQDLHPFLTGLFARLRSGAYIIVATPLMSPWFYDDFDHIRPYHPQGLLMAFAGGRSEQVQYSSPYRLELKDIHFRRSPLKFQFARRLYTDRGLRWPRPANWLLIAAFHSSFHVIGTTDGWMGLFQLHRDVT